MTWDDSVDIASGRGWEHRGVAVGFRTEAGRGKRFFFFSKASKYGLAPTQLPGAVAHEIKQSGCETDKEPLYVYIYSTEFLPPLLQVSCLEHEQFLISFSVF